MVHWLLIPLTGKIRCDYITCFRGLGLAGHESCVGMWWHPCCPAYEDEDEVLREWNRWENEHY